MAKNHRTHRARFTLALAGAAVLVLAGCGSANSGAAGTTQAGQTTATPGTDSATPSSAAGGEVT
ncbi:MAG: hypothetical protein ABWZ98_02330, partial [Nakamurella sp.]